MENPIRVAMEELQLQDLSTPSAEAPGSCGSAHLVMEDAACAVQKHASPLMHAEVADIPSDPITPTKGIPSTAPILVLGFGCCGEVQESRRISPTLLVLPSCSIQLVSAKRRRLVALESSIEKDTLFLLAVTKQVQSTPAVAKQSRAYT